MTHTKLKVMTASTRRVIPVSRQPIYLVDIGVNIRTLKTRKHLMLFRLRKYFTMRIIKRITVLLTIIYACTSSGHAQISNNCGLEEFRCHNGQCIQSHFLCDGIVHCEDRSDETETECKKPYMFCPDYAFVCNYGACVNKDSVCNGISDCADNSDETQPQCKTAGNNLNNQTKQICKMNEFRCDDGQCISSIALCNGTPNCMDGSDEVFEKCGSISCAATVFRCNYGACIDGNLRCNGVANCADKSDENPEICGSTSASLPPWSPPTITTITTPKSVSSYPFNKCRAPPQPQNGQWKLDESLCPNNQNCDIAEGEELNVGTYIIYSCNPGYRLEGYIYVSCSLQGKWLTIPVCTEIRCKGLSTSSVAAICTYNRNWVSCENPVLPGTTAELSCQNSYKRESSVLSTQRNVVTCNTNGQWEPDPIRCVAVCGKVSTGITPSIVNGNLPDIVEFPWHASLYRDDPDEPKKFFCGASIIRDNLLITAAHCIYDDDIQQVTNATVYVVTGNLYRDYDSPMHDSRLVKKNKVKNIYIRCNYIGISGNFAWDIAILQLENPFVLSSWLVPICIDNFGDQAVLQVGSYGKVAGFGRTEYGTISSILQYLMVPYVPPNECKSASQISQTEEYLTTDKFCAGYTNGSSVCDGDSGGGLVFETRGLWFLRGIVSASLGAQGVDLRCNNNLYSLYTQISSHIAWIQDIISSVERNSSYSPCPNKLRTK